MKQINKLKKKKRNKVNDSYATHTKYCDFIRKFIFNFEN